MIKTKNNTNLEVSLDIVSEDERYPILVITSEQGATGYALDLNSLALQRVCICAAHSASECACGAWDED